MKRIFLFILTNILVILTINIVLSILGVNHYLSASGINYQSLMVFCLVYGFVGSFISLMISKFMAKTMMGVQIIAPNAPGPYSSLVHRIHHLARHNGLQKMPEVGVYESPEINAFATGPSKNNSLVAVSTGLLQKMTDDEVEAVLAHEIGHIANGDMVTMALVQGVINAFVMFFARVAAFLLQQALRGNSDDREEGSSFSGGWTYMLTTMLFEMVFGFLGMYVVSYFSRHREFRADASAAKSVGANKMIAALQRLKSNYETMSQTQSGGNFQAFKISSKTGGLMAMLSTHPSLDLRIEALKKNPFGQ